MSSDESSSSDSEGEHAGLYLLPQDAVHNTIRRRIPIFLSPDVITTVHDRDETRKLKDRQVIEPFRLVMISKQDNCQFCTDPQGDVNCHFIRYDYGFVSCTCCYEQAKVYLADWLATKSFGRAHVLMDKDIRIRRSAVNPDTGTAIESGWRLKSDNPVVVVLKDIEHVECFNPDKTLVRYCPIDELLTLNPPIKKEESKTLN